MIRLLSGDCRDVLATLPAESVQCVVTSPPYLGLRDYGTALWDGGDAGCDHGESYRKRRNEQRAADCGDGGIRRSERDPQTAVCRCGAVRVDRQIGLEATPDEYLATMVGVFRQIRRVLRTDGTVWCNLGDSYSGGGGDCPTAPSNLAGSLSSYAGDGKAVPGGALRNTGLAAKQLLLMPARLALALQADGWWVRSDVIWHKPNPMPESCRDRPTSAHEHVFLLTKSARYYFDNEAIREPYNEATIGRYEYKFQGSTSPGRHQPDNRDERYKESRDGAPNPAGRSCRNVWTIATHAYPDAHFATFPPELAERCIKAGTSERGCCAACGKPWVRVTERGAPDLAHQRACGGNANGEYRGKSTKGHAAAGVRDASEAKANILANMVERITTGWSPGCECHGHFEEREAAPDWISEETGERKRVRVWVADGDAPPPVPCVVLDPFIGAGTTALVADRLQRDCIGIDLNTGYTEMAMERVRADAPLFTSFAPAEPPEDERMGDLFQDMAAD